MLGYKHTKHLVWVYGTVFTFSVLGFLVRLTKMDALTTQQNIKIYILSLLLISFTWEALRFVNRKLNVSFPFERNVTMRIVIQLGLGAVIGLIVRFLIYHFGEPLLPFKLDTLFSATTWFLYALLPAIINLGFISHQLLNYWRDTLVMNERLEKEKSQVQFDNLKNQLNPHFLFNALTSLNSLIMENQELASQFVQQLSKVYRYVLQNKEKSYVSLRTELDFIQHYVSLLQTRFQKALKIEFDISTTAEELHIVPVTLQILIENAIKHNILDAQRPLQIDIFTSGDYLIVSNNLQVRSNVESSNKQGLNNMKSLYTFLTENPVIIEQNDSRFSVKVPLV